MSVVGSEPTALAPETGDAPPGDDDPPAASSRGDVEGRLRDPEIRIEQVYRTPFETHSPMEPHATLAVWDGPKSLTLYDATQGIFDCRDRVANFLEKRSAAALHGLAVPPYIESVVNKVTMELPYKRLIVVARVRDEDAVQNGTPDRINV